MEKNKARKETRKYQEQGGREWGGDFTFTVVWEPLH